jgi:hypothetical protein
MDDTHSTLPPAHEDELQAGGDDGDTDDEFELVPALPVGAGEMDPSRPPADGFEYIRQVRSALSPIPAILNQVAIVTPVLSLQIRGAPDPQGASCFQGCPGFGRIAICKN